jgi:hypothetical protein
MDLCQFFNNFCQCLTERSEKEHDVSVVLRPLFRVTQSKTLLEEDPGTTRTHPSRNPQSIGVRFHAMLGEDPKVEVALV